MEKKDIDELSIKNDIEIIKPYLISKGYDFLVKSEYDIFSYAVARKDDKRYLSFGIFNYNGELFGAPNYDCEFGQIIYDTNGKILLDCVKCDSINIEYDYEKKENYIELDSSDIFMDDYVVISKINESFVPYYSVYKLENGSYIHKGDCEGIGVILEKTPSGELLINNHGRLHGVRDFKNLNDLVFKDIISSNCDKESIRFAIDYLCSSSPSEVKDNILNIINNNDLLLAYDYIDSDLYCGLNNRMTIFTFLNTKGDIASKLFVKSSHKFYSMDVDNKSYEEAKEKIRERLNEEIERNIKKEKKKVIKERHLCSRSREKLIKTLSNFKEN